MKMKISLTNWVLLKLPIYHQKNLKEQAAVNKNVDKLIKHSVTQRRNFIDELEGKIKGLNGEQNTPRFTNLIKEEVKEFNFDKELERLKRTLTDIKDQESRFIKLLSKHSPSDASKYNEYKSDKIDHSLKFQNSIHTNINGNVIPHTMIVNNEKKK